MKQILRSIFEYIGNPDNFALSVILILIYSLVCLMLGMLIACIVRLLVYRKVDKDPFCFDDFIEHTNEMSSIKVRRAK